MTEMIMQHEWRGPTWYVYQAREISYLPHAENLRKGPCSRHKWNEVDGNEACCTNCGVTGDLGHIHIRGACTTKDLTLPTQTIALAEITDGKLVGEVTPRHLRDGRMEFTCRGPIQEVK